MAMVAAGWAAADLAVAARAKAAAGSVAVGLAAAAEGSETASDPSAEAQAQLGQRSSQAAQAAAGLPIPTGAQGGAEALTDLLEEAANLLAQASGEIEDQALGQARLLIDGPRLGEAGEAGSGRIKFTEGVAIMREVHLGAQVCVEGLQLGVGRMHHSRLVQLAVMKDRVDSVHWQLLEQGLVEPRVGREQHPPID